MSELEALFEQRRELAKSHKRAWAYYHNEANPPWMNQGLQQFFRKNSNYRQNWISVIVDAITDRLIVDGFDAGNNATATEQIETLWDRMRLSEHAAQVHQDVVTTGEGYVLYERDGDRQVMSRQDPECMAALYDDDIDPQKLTAAAKFYIDDDRRKAIVWTDTEVQHYETGNSDAPSTADDYRLTETEVNEYGVIPVFHFRRSMRRVLPDFYSVIPLQDSLNKTFVMLGVVTEIGACKVRYIKGEGETADMPEILPGDTIGLGEGQDIGELEGDDPGRWLKVIDSLALAMASTTRTPRHFFSAAEGNIPSGEALQAMEAPLIRKVEGYHTRLEHSWIAAMGFFARVNGVAVDDSEINLVWRNPRTMLMISQAQARESNVRAGMPLRTQLRKEGWRENELDQMLEDRETERPVEMDEAAIEQMYDHVAQRTERIIEPAIATALEALSDAVLDEVTRGDRLQRLARAVQAEPE